MEKVFKLSMDDVIASDTNNGIVNAETFKCQEAVMKLASKANIHWAIWTQNGMKCQVIGANTGGWMKGKIRICFEFIPDETQPPIPQPFAQVSPLDDLRQQLKDLNQ